MDPNQSSTGSGTMHTATTQNTDLSKSLLVTPFVPGGGGGGGGEEGPAANHYRYHQNLNQHLHQHHYHQHLHQHQPEPQPQPQPQPKLSNSLPNTPFVPSGGGEEEGDGEEQEQEQGPPTNHHEPQPKHQPPPQPQPVPGLKLPPSNIHPCTWPDCPRFFASPHNVQQHIREKHTGERPFKCDVCAAAGFSTAFARPYGLTRHKAQVHGDGRKVAKGGGGGKRQRCEEEGDVDAGGDDAGEVDVGSDGGRAGKRRRVKEEDGGGGRAREFGVGSNGGVLQREGNQATGGAEDEFAELGALLTAANAEMDRGGDVQMSSADTQVGGTLPETQQQRQQQPANGVRFICENCGYASADSEDVLCHMHLTHSVANTSFCSCGLCAFIFFGSEQKAVNHALLLGLGGFQVGQEAAGPGVEEGPVSMDFGATPARTSSDWEANVDWEDVTIDPALLR